MPVNREIRPLLWFILFMFAVPVVFLVWASAYTNGNEVTVAEAAVTEQDTEVSFAEDVMPIFEIHCFQCHGERRLPGVRTSLRLTSYESLMAGGAVLPAVVPGDPDNSQLFLLLDRASMPRDGERLRDRDIATIRHWILQGAPDN